MSEFSDSVHLFACSPAQAARALERAGGGVVLASNERATTVLMAWEDKPALLEAQPGLALDYSYGQDHGVWLRFYEDGLCRARLEVSWGDDEFPEDEEPEVSAELVSFLTKLVREADAQRIGAIADELAECPRRGREARVDELGALLQLPAFRQASCEQIEHGGLDALPTAFKVRKA